MMPISTLDLVAFPENQSLCLLLCPCRQSLYRVAQEVAVNSTLINGCLYEVIKDNYYLRP